MTRPNKSNKFLLYYVGQSQKVDEEPAKIIPLGWYDCGDGFYNPDNRVVYDYNMKFLRNAGTLTLRYLESIPVHRY